MLRAGKNGSINRRPQAVFASRPAERILPATERLLDSCPRREWCEIESVIWRLAGFAPSYIRGDQLATNNRIDFGVLTRKTADSNRPGGKLSAVQESRS